MSELGDTRAPGTEPLTGGGSGEDEAWAQVVARWDDEAAHRAYLAGYNDLEGIGRAGRRYRAVLAERPGDAMAQRMREVVVKKATALGFASLPRTTPPREESPRLRKVKLALYFSLGSSGLYLAYLLVQHLAQLLGSKP
jgi:hypothetical protein